MSNKNNNRMQPREILWICMAAMCLIIGINRTLKYGFAESWEMYAFAAASFLFFIWRRHLRKKENESNGDGKMQ